MSVHNLTADGELRYIVQWFNEWSELQRDDFVPILAEYLVHGGPGVYMNGLVGGLAAVACEDKPMSLFQCRVKLFREWSGKWPEEQKLKLKEKVLEIDPVVAEKLETELAAGNVPNGNVSPDLVAPAPVIVVQEAIVA